MSWINRANAVRSNKVISAIAKRQGITINRALSGFEELFSDKGDKELLNLLDEVLNEIYPNRSSPDELLKEMVSLQPTPVEVIKLNIAEEKKKAAERVSLMLQAKKKKALDASQAVQRMIGGK